MNNTPTDITTNSFDAVGVSIGVSIGVLIELKEFAHCFID